jgi:hypothetical protein
METILFIPPVSATTKPQNRKATVWCVAGGVVLVTVILSFFLLKKSQQQTNQTNFKPEPSLPKPAKIATVESLQKQTTPTSLKPVFGAFGWQLGEKLPERFRRELLESDYASIYIFTPEQEWPPFNSFSLDVTPDGRICSVNATAVVRDTEEFYASTERLISLLTEKYGLRLHDHEPNGPNTTVEDEYKFGTPERTAHLQIHGNAKQIWLTYYDNKLKEIADNAHAAVRAKLEADKKAALKKGL